LRYGRGLHAAKGRAGTEENSARRKVIEYVLVSTDGVFEDPVAMGVGEYQDEAHAER
jgi:hypothetical protein